MLYHPGPSSLSRSRTELGAKPANLSPKDGGNRYDERDLYRIEAVTDPVSMPAGILTQLQSLWWEARTVGTCIQLPKGPIFRSRFTPAKLFCHERQFGCARLRTWNTHPIVLLKKRPL